ncbi:MAG: LptF/LptG family permease [Chloroflexota bacterium]
MNLIDRYILKQFVNTLIFAIVALCAIFLVVDLIENLDDFIDQNAKFPIILKYYLNYFPEILKLLTPVASLLATLFTIGKLSNQNEVTAMKTGGMSLYRLMFPLAAFSLALSFFQLYFNGWIVPASNRRKVEIEQVYLNKNTAGSQIYNLYFRESPTRNLIMQYYDENSKTAHRVIIEDFSGENSPRLTRRIEADRMRWDSAANKWSLYNGIDRSFSGLKISASRFDSTKFSLAISHNEIKRLRLTTGEMNLTELKEYIDQTGRGGKDVSRQMIDYYGQWAFPFANFIVVLFGVPFASVKKKGGIAIQIGAAMVIAFTYLIFTKFSQTLAYSLGLDPILAGWSANIIFAIFGLIVLLRTKT